MMNEVDGMKQELSVSRWPAMYSGVFEVTAT